MFCSASFRFLFFREVLCGSSPPLRGTQTAAGKCKQEPRFIPACAGEHIIVFLPPFINAGSSPRVRGTRYGTAMRAQTGKLPDPRPGEVETADALASSRCIHACASHLEDLQKYPGAKLCPRQLREGLPVRIYGPQ